MTSLPIDKHDLLEHCREEVLDVLQAGFESVAINSKATALEVLSAALTFALTSALFIEDPKQRQEIVSALAAVAGDDDNDHMH